MSLSYFIIVTEVHCNTKLWHLQYLKGKKQTTNFTILSFELEVFNSGDGLLAISECSSTMQRNNWT